MYFNNNYPNKSVNVYGFPVLLNKAADIIEPSLI